IVQFAFFVPTGPSLCLLHAYLASVICKMANMNNAAAIETERESVSYKENVKLVFPTQNTSACSMSQPS
ncbi:hypothetical protein BDV40DRAFT_265496, partial [Aspergillus tamarii]